MKLCQKITEVRDITTRCTDIVVYCQFPSRLGYRVMTDLLHVQYRNLWHWLLISETQN